MSIQDLERRLQTLEDIDAIKNLKARYCALCDAGFDADGLAGLFTEDAVWEGGSFGHYEGREAIRKFYRGIPQQLSFAAHFVMNSQVEVSGDRAVGRWKLLEPCTFSGTYKLSGLSARVAPIVQYDPISHAVWGAADYEDEFIKVNGEWKFKKVTLVPVFYTPYEDGWFIKKSVLD